MVKTRLPPPPYCRKKTKKKRSNSVCTEPGVLARRVLSLPALVVPREHGVRLSAP
jgi:hypothetical protein